MVWCSAELVAELECRNCHAHLASRPALGLSGGGDLHAGVIGAQVLSDKILPVDNDLQNLIGKCFSVIHPTVVV